MANGSQPHRTKSSGNRGRHVVNVETINVDLNSICIIMIYVSHIVTLSHLPNSLICLQQRAILAVWNRYLKDWLRFDTLTAADDSGSGDLCELLKMNS